MGSIAPDPIISLRGNLPGDNMTISKLGYNEINKKIIIAIIFSIGFVFLLLAVIFFIPKKIIITKKNFIGQDLAYRCLCGGLTFNIFTNKSDRCYGFLFDCKENITFGAPSAEEIWQMEKNKIIQ
jgi:hypothetical protein